MTAAIRTGFVNGSMASNWILGSQNMSQTKLVMPRIERGNGRASKVAEGANIPVGSLRFGKKDVSVFKVGTGFSITDELVEGSSIDMMFEFLQEAGNDMSIGRDVEAMRVLVSGEQADGSESTPIIGVTDTAAGLQLADIDRVVERMRRLNRPANRIITSETIKQKDLNSEYSARERILLEAYFGRPVDCHVLPTLRQLLFLATDKSMVELNYKTMKVERQRNPQNQTDDMYVSTYIGFAKVRRDATVIVDTEVAFSPTIGAAGGFPAYMDIDARISEAFKSF
jgi:hypothetical protein